MATMMRNRNLSVTDDMLEWLCTMKVVCLLSRCNGELSEETTLMKLFCMSGEIRRRTVDVTLGLLLMIVKLHLPSFIKKSPRGVRNLYSGLAEKINNLVMDWKTASWGLDRKY